MAEKPVEVWNTPDRGRYFLIPADMAMPTGALTIAQGIRKKRTVDAELAAQFEVTPAEARTHLADKAQSAFAKVREAFGGARKQRAEASGTPLEDDWKNPMPKNASDLFGVDPAVMMSDREAAKKGASNLLNFIVRAARDATGDEGVKKTIDDGLSRLEAEIDNPDGQLAKAFQAATDQLQTAAPILGARIDELGDALKTAAAKIRDETTPGEE